MQITLKPLSFTGLSGIAKAIDCATEAWVQDIYSNQMHSIISGAVPLRGAVNVGTSFRDLLMVPIVEFRQMRRLGSKRRGNVGRELRRGATKLLQTLTHETLHLSHKTALMLAAGIMLCL